MDESQGSTWAEVVSQLLDLRARHGRRYTRRAWCCWCAAVVSGQQRGAALAQ